MDNLVGERGALSARPQKTWSSQNLNAHREFLALKVPLTGKTFKLLSIAVKVLLHAAQL